MCRDCTEDAAGNWIDRLSLLSHPEGGHYRETYRSEMTIPESALPDAVKGERNCSTAIYYLLERTEFSAFHRIQSDELWHSYAGSTLLIHELKPDGSYQRWKLGIEPNASPQVVIAAGSWFAAELVDNDSYALVGCTVAPGFDFRDFELADADALILQYPEHAALIRRLG